VIFGTPEYTTNFNYSYCTDNCHTRSSVPEDITTYIILYAVRVCEKEVRTGSYVRLLRILLYAINGIIILFLCLKMV
jgi:hypothetical protein